MRSTTISPMKRRKKTITAAVKNVVHRDPRESFHMPPELRDALQRYCDSQRPRVVKSEVLRVALEEFLKGRGYGVSDS